MILCLWMFSYQKTDVNFRSMKIEIEVKEELAEKVGIETLKAFLQRKVEQMEDKLRQNVDGVAVADEYEKEILQKAWNNFNKREISC